MRARGKQERVIAAIETGRCNTSRDVADETGLLMREASKVVSSLIDLGVLRDTGRRIPVAYRNHKLTVFEVVA